MILVTLPTQSWFPHFVTDDFSGQLYVAKSESPPVSTQQDKKKLIDTNAKGSFQVIGECLQSGGLSPPATDITLVAWNSSTTKQYCSYLKRWVSF